MEKRIKSVVPIGDDLWRINAVVRIGPKNFKTQRLTFKGRLDAALAKLGEMKNALKADVSPNSSLKSADKKKYLTFGECLNRYSESNGTSWEEYRKTDLMDHVGAVPLPNLPDEFDRFIELTKVSPTSRGEPPRPASVNKLIVLAKAATRFCYRLGLIDRDPLRSYKKLDEMNERESVISDLEFHTLLKALPLDLQPIVRFAYRIPTRFGELIKLQNQKKNIKKGMLEFKPETTKTKKGRMVAIPSELLSYFKNIPENCEWAFYRVKHNGSTPVYLPMVKFQKAWKRACTAAEMEDFRFHDLRRVAASNLARQGVSESIIKKLGGWRTDIFFKRYRSIDDDELKFAVNGKRAKTKKKSIQSLYKKRAA